MALYLETPEQFGRAVTHLREKRGWSQVQLAEISGISRAMISAIETGHSLPSFRTALILVSVFGMALAIAPLPAPPGEPTDNGQLTTENSQ